MEERYRRIHKGAQETQWIAWKQENANRVAVGSQPSDPKQHVPNPREATLDSMLIAGGCWTQHSVHIDGR